MAAGATSDGCCWASELSAQVSWAEEAALKSLDLLRPHSVNSSPNASSPKELRQRLPQPQHKILSLLIAEKTALLRLLRKRGSVPVGAYKRPRLTEPPALTAAPTTPPSTSASLTGLSPLKTISTPWTTTAAALTLQVQEPTETLRLARAAAPDAGEASQAAPPCPGEGPSSPGSPTLTAGAAGCAEEPGFDSTADEETANQEGPDAFQPDWSPDRDPLL